MSLPHDGEILLLSILWILIIVSVLTTHYVINRWFVAAIIVLALVQIWEKIGSIFKGYSSKFTKNILWLQALILGLTLCWTFQSVSSLVFLVLVFIFFLVSLWDKNSKQFYKYMALISLLGALFVIRVNGCVKLTLLMCILAFTLVLLPLGEKKKWKAPELL
jgi:hypothetical protein